MTNPAHTFSPAPCPACEANGIGGRFGCHRLKSGRYPDDVDFARRKPTRTDEPSGDPWVRK